MGSLFFHGFQEFLSQFLSPVPRRVPWPFDCAQRDGAGKMEAVPPLMSDGHAPQAADRLRLVFHAAVSQRMG